MTRYRIKKLIPGYKIGQKYLGEMMIAVPHFTGPIEVIYGDQIMLINKWSDKVEENWFKDKYNRDHSYTLGYYIWNPTEQIRLL